MKQGLGGMERALKFAREIEGAPLYNFVGVQIGWIDRLLIDPLNSRVRIAFVLASISGLEGSSVPVPTSRIHLRSGDEKYVTSVTKAQLTAALRHADGAAHTSIWADELEAHYDTPAA
jgi:hypothetical protein